MSQSGDKIPQKISWNEQEFTEIPTEIDQLGRNALPYDQQLISSMDLPSSEPAPVVEKPTAPPSHGKRQPQGKKGGKSGGSSKDTPSGPTAEPSYKERITLFKSKWESLRSKCPEPQTPRIMVETVRNDILVILKETKVVSRDVVDLLDLNWDMLRTNRVVLFLSKFYTRHPNFAMIEGSGALSYLTGMIESMKETETDIMTEYLESQANVIADLKLAAASIEMFRESIAKAESTWREQSTLCSTYLCSLESALKTIKISLDSAGSKTVNPSGPSPKTSGIKHDLYSYLRTSDGWAVVYDGVEDKKVSIIVKQVAAIINSQTDPEVLLKVPPETIYIDFKSAYGEIKDPKKAIAEICKQYGKLHR